jgi:hypothetical protein
MTVAVRVLAYTWHWVGLYLSFYLGAIGLNGYIVVVVLFTAFLATLVCSPEIAFVPAMPTVAQHAGLLLLVIAASAVVALVLWGLVRLWTKFCY